MLMIAIGGKNFEGFFINGEVLDLLCCKAGGTLTNHIFWDEKDVHREEDNGLLNPGDRSKSK